MPGRDWRELRRTLRTGFCLNCKGKLLLMLGLCFFCGRQYFMCSLQVLGCFMLCCVLCDVRLERLEYLVKKFKHKCSIHEEWAVGKVEGLQAEDYKQMRLNDVRVSTAVFLYRFQ